MRKIDLDILKAVKAQNRAEEILKHGKLISFRRTISRNRKKYSRKGYRLDYE